MAYHKVPAAGGKLPFGYCPGDDRFAVVVSAFV